MPFFTLTIGLLKLISLKKEGKILKLLLEA